MKKTLKSTRKALKKGFKIEFNFNNKKNPVFVILIRNKNTGNLVNSLGVESKGLTDKKCAKKINNLVKSSINGAV